MHLTAHEPHIPTTHTHTVPNSTPPSPLALSVHTNYSFCPPIVLSCCGASSLSLPAQALRKRQASASSMEPAWQTSFTSASTAGSHTTRTTAGRIRRSSRVHLAHACATAGIGVMRAICAALAMCRLLTHPHAAGMASACWTPSATVNLGSRRVLIRVGAALPVRPNAGAGPGTFALGTAYAGTTVRASVKTAGGCLHASASVMAASPTPVTATESAQQPEAACAMMPSASKIAAVCARAAPPSPTSAAATASATRRVCVSVRMAGRARRVTAWQTG